MTAPLRNRQAGSGLVLLMLALVLFSGFVALGTWQVVRLQWKLDLIARVEARVRAAPVALPAQSEWPAVSAATHEYRHVRVDGVFDYTASAAVQAVTELGRGFWVLTPLRRTDGTVVLINRGFIAEEERAQANRPGPAGPVTLTGLLRLSERGGGFLHQNDPAHDRWYSRDVAAIATTRHLNPVAPFFIDADAAARLDTPVTDPAVPVGGLTVIAFHNNHLVYALTWYALAAMVAGVFVWRRRLSESA